jgi:hypothetical protein
MLKEGFSPKEVQQHLENSGFTNPKPKPLPLPK